MGSGDGDRDQLVDAVREKTCEERRESMEKLWEERHENLGGRLKSINSKQNFVIGFLTVDFIGILILILGLFFKLSN